MRAISNAISFFLLILAEKKAGGATLIFQTYPIETSFYIKCLISEKQCVFPLCKITNHNEIHFLL